MWTIMLPSWCLVCPAADDDFVIFWNAPCGQVLMFLRWCLVHLQLMMNLFQGNAICKSMLKYSSIQSKQFSHYLSHKSIYESLKSDQDSSSSNHLVFCSYKQSCRGTSLVLYIFSSLNKNLFSSNLMRSWTSALT